MNKKSFAIASLAIGLSLTAHAETETGTREYLVPKCSKPVASIVIGKVTCKASTCQNQSGGRSNPLAALLAMAGQPSVEGVGDGMGDMLLSSLKATGCFDIQEREAMDEINKELALVGRKVEAKPADYMISGAITSININQDRGGFGFGLIPIIGSINRTTMKVNMDMDFRLIDVNKARVLDSHTFTANSEHSSFGIGGGGWGAGVGVFGGSFSKMNNTPLGNVARETILQATTYITETLAKNAITSRVPVAPAKKAEN